MMPEQRELPRAGSTAKVGAVSRTPRLHDATGNRLSAATLTAYTLEAHFMTRSAALRAGTIFVLLTLFFGAIGLSAYVAGAEVLR